MVIFARKVLMATSLEMLIAKCRAEGRDKELARLLATYSKINPAANEKLPKEVKK